MDNVAIAAVTMVSVRYQQPGQDTRELLWIGELEHQVEVVAHKAVMIQAQAMAAAVAIHESQKSGAVRVIGEYGLALLPSVKAMVTSCPGPVEMSGETRHGSSRLWP
jgi:hypothetical protein